MLRTHASQRVSQSVPVIHTKSCSGTSISCPRVTPPPPPHSAVGGSWLRPAVAALAASGADPPHFNASDIYLGRTTGGRGGGGGGRSMTASQRHRWTRIVAHPELPIPPLPWRRCPTGPAVCFWGFFCCCFVVAEETTCSACFGVTALRVCGFSD